MTQPTSNMRRQSRHRMSISRLESQTSPSERQTRHQNHYHRLVTSTVMTSNDNDDEEDKRQDDTTIAIPSEHAGTENAPRTPSFQNLARFCVRQRLERPPWGISGFQVRVKPTSGPGGRVQGQRGRCGWAGPVAPWSSLQPVFEQSTRKP